MVDYKLDQSKKENFDQLNNMKKSHSSAMSKAKKDLDHIHHHLKVPTYKQLKAIFIQKQCFYRSPYSLYTVSEDQYRTHSK